MAESDLESLCAKLQAAELRAQAAERDRDWWITQHDAVMQDWRDDLDQVAQASAIRRPELATESGSERLHKILASLLAFFDPETGSVSFRLGAETLPDVFGRASAAFDAIGAGRIEAEPSQPDLAPPSPDKITGR